MKNITRRGFLQLTAATALVCASAPLTGCGKKNTKKLVLGDWYMEGYSRLEYAIYDDGSCQVRSGYGLGKWSIVNDDKLRISDFYGQTLIYKIEKISKKLMKELDEDRYRHTQGVMYTSAALAMRYGADLKKALLAGLLHDCAKCIPNKKKLKMCSQHNIPVSEFEQTHPFLLHAKLGAYVAKAKYNITDEDILSAITWHTTGKPEMTLLEKIVYIADYIEPKRDKAPNLAIVRKLAFQDLDLTLVRILKDTLFYLREKGNETDPMTQKTYDYYAGF